LPGTHRVAAATTGQPFAGLEAWLTQGRFALVLAAFMLIEFADVLAGGNTFFYRDYGLYGLPYAFYHRECFWQWQLPHWLPLTNCGIPYLAQWCTMTLYPPALIYLLLPFPWSLSVFCLLHQFFGGLGMYWLAHRWTGHRLAAALAGLIFAFNGLTMSTLMWPALTAALGWTPWVFGLVQRAWQQGGRAMFPAIGAGALQMLTGAPENIVLTWVLTGGLWLFEWVRKDAPRGLMALRATLVVAAVAGLAALQLAPFLELLRHSHRGTGYGGDFWAMPGTGWANFLVPQFYTFPAGHGVRYQPDQILVSSYYLGIGTVLLVVLAVARSQDARRWWLAGVCLFFLVLTLGSAGRLFTCLREVAPAVTFMRFPIKLTYPVAFLVPLLVGLAVAFYGRLGPAEWRRERCAVWLASASLLGLMAGIVWFAGAHPHFTEKYHAWNSTWQSGVTRAGFLLLTTAALLAASYARRVQVQWILGAGVLALLWADLHTHVPRINPTVTTRVFALGLSQQVGLTARWGQSRVMDVPASEESKHMTKVPDPELEILARRAGLMPNLSLLDGVPIVGGAHSLFLGWMHEVRNLMRRSGKAQREALTDFLAVSHASAEDGGSLDWTTRHSFHPLVTGGQHPVFLGPRETLDALVAPGLDLARTVFLPPEIRPHLSVRTNSTVAIREAQFGTERVAFETEADALGLVVVAQAFYPSWKAYVDGRGTKLFRANHAFQALEVPAGRHKVELRYEDRAFQAGLWVSATTFLAVAGAWWWQRRRGGSPLTGVSSPSPCAAGRGLGRGESCAAPTDLLHMNRRVGQASRLSWVWQPRRTALLCPPPRFRGSKREFFPSILSPPLSSS
jgi:hypothetical protein